MPAPTLAPNPFSNPNPGGVIGAINKATGLAQQNMQSKAPVSINGTGAVGPLAPGKTGLAQQNLGVKAKSPQDNVTKIPTTLPASQTSSGSPFGNTVAKTPGYADTGSSTPAPAPTPTNGTGTSTNPYNIAVGGLAGANLANQQLGQNAQNIAGLAGQQITDIGKQAARIEQNYGDSVNGLSGTGLAQNVANAAANQQQAITAGANMGLAGNAQALTGQAQTQSAQQAAGALTQPQITSYGQTSFNPATGQFDQGGSLPLAVLNQYAQMAANGQYSAIPSSITSNPVLSAQLNAAAQSINPNYSPIVSSAQGATTAQNVQTLGTTPTTTNANIGSTAQKAAAELSQTMQNFGNVGQIATNFLTSNLGLNPTQIPAVNTSIGKFMASVQNPAAVSQYNLIMNDASALQAAILGSYGATTPSANVSATLKTDPTTLPVNQLQSWLSTIEQLGNSQLNSVQNTVNSAYGAGSGSTYAGTPTSVNTSTTTTPNATAQGLSAGNLARAAAPIVGNVIQGVGSDILNFITNP